MFYISYNQDPTNIYHIFDTVMPANQHCILTMLMKKLSIWHNEPWQYLWRGTCIHYLEMFKLTNRAIVYMIGILNVISFIILYVAFQKFDWRICEDNSKIILDNVHNFLFGSVDIIHNTIYNTIQYIRLKLLV